MAGLSEDVVLGSCGGMDVGRREGVPRNTRKGNGRASREICGEKNAFHHEVHEDHEGENAVLGRYDCWSR